jgi:hypothetical protein
MVALPACGAFGDDEPDVVVSGGQTWSGRTWFVQLDAAQWSGCTVAVEVTIMYTGGTVANFGFDHQDEVGSLYALNKYGEVFEPHKAWPWETQFYEEKYYPNETRSGEVKFEIDPRSEQLWLRMSPEFPEVQSLSFDLGAVPVSCD